MTDTMEQGEGCGEKFTPGPWYVRTLNGHGFDQVHAGHDDFCIADVDMINGKGGLASVGLCDGTRKPKRGELEANARLIASAPELYEALKGLIEAMHSTSRTPMRDIEKAIENGRAALLKASGGKDV